MSSTRFLKFVADENGPLLVRAKTMARAKSCDSPVPCKSGTESRFKLITEDATAPVKVGGVIGINPGALGNETPAGRRRGVHSNVTPVGKLMSGPDLG